MLSQLTLRFPKNLIERLKNRATTENTSVNALAERLMENSLAGSAAGEEYLQLVTDPDAAVARLYRQLILGQHSGLSSLSRGEHEKPWGNHRMARHLGLEYSILLSPSSLSSYEDLCHQSCRPWGQSYGLASAKDCSQYISGRTSLHNPDRAGLGR